MEGKKFAFQPACYTDGSGTEECIKPVVGQVVRDLVEIHFVKFVDLYGDIQYQRNNIVHIEDGDPVMERMALAAFFMPELLKTIIDKEDILLV